MCVYPLTVPISSLSISLPPGSWPICLPGLRAWSHRSGPCQPHWNISVCVCVWIGGWAWERMRVCTSICYNRGASCDRSPLTSALGEGACSCICGLLLLQTTDVLCSYASAYDHVQVFVLAWGPICLRLFFEEMPDSRPVKAPFPLLSPRHLFRNQMGCQGHLWPPAALWLTGQARLTTPLLLYPDGHLTLLRPIH